MKHSILIFAFSFIALFSFSQSGKPLKVKTKPNTDSTAKKVDSVQGPNVYVLIFDGPTIDELYNAIDNSTISNILVKQLKQAIINQIQHQPTFTSGTSGNISTKDSATLKNQKK